MTMEMHLQPLATSCFISGEPFVEGARIASYLVRATTLEIVRYDLLEAHANGFAPEGFVACRWVHVFKPRRGDLNADRTLKLTAENLFVALADPTTEPTPESTRLVQFLALMLERKANQLLFATRDQKEGMQAFIEKRKPDWSAT